MSRRDMFRCLPLIPVAVVLALSGGCHGVGGGVRIEARAGYSHPPARRPVHPHAHPYRYYYYPGAAVYFDTGRGVYFYLSGRRWISAITLPPHLRGPLGAHVELELDTPEPWRDYRRHRQIWPPGHFAGERGTHRERHHEDGD